MTVKGTHTVPKRYCPYCGKLFQPERMVQQFCSRDCANRFRARESVTKGWAATYCAKHHPKCVFFQHDDNIGWYCAIDLMSDNEGSQFVDGKCVKFMEGEEKEGWRAERLKKSLETI